MEQSPDRIASEYPVLEHLLQAILRKIKRLKIERTTPFISPKEMEEIVANQASNYHLRNIVCEVLEIPAAERGTKNIHHTEEDKNEFIEIVTAALLEAEENSETTMPEIAETIMESFKSLLGCKTDLSERVTLDPKTQERLKELAGDNVTAIIGFTKWRGGEISENLDKKYGSRRRFN